MTPTTFKEKEHILETNFSFGQTNFLKENIGTEPYKQEASLHLPIANYDEQFLTSKSSYKNQSKVLPELLGLDSPDPFLTNRIKSLLADFWAIVASQALQTNFEIIKAELMTTKDPNSDRSQIVIRLFTNLNAIQTMSFWNSLNSRLQDWTQTLSEANRLRFLNSVSLRIHWS